MPPIAITYIISNIDKALEFEWVAERLDKTKLNLSFILLNKGDSELEQFLNRIGVPCHRITYNGKLDIPICIFQVYSLLRANNIDIVHTHLMDACLVGLTAAVAARVPVRIYTRHHSTLHYEYHRHAILYDWYANWLATDVIAISENVARILRERERVSPDHVHLIYHGLELDQFLNTDPRRIAALRLKYNPQHKAPVIGAISRYVHWKGLQFIIPAFQELLCKYPNALLILANAKKGDHKDEIAASLSGIPPESFLEIEFEKDNAALYGIFDIFVHVPIDDHSEAFGQVYIESLAAGVPSIFTISGIAREFIRDGENALVVSYKDSGKILAAIRTLLKNNGLLQALAKQGKNDVGGTFTIQKKVAQLEALYIQCAR